MIRAPAALKAFLQVPNAVVPLRVQRNYRLIECFDCFEAEVALRIEDLLDLYDHGVTVGLMFREYLGALLRWTVCRQGGAGYLLTFSHALIELFELGYVYLERAAHPALETMISPLRNDPGKGEPGITDHSRQRYTPLEIAYWRNKERVLSRLGDVFKYLYYSFLVCCYR